MKKLAKPLILLLVVSLLAGAFIFSALAEDASSTSAVGSYTQPEGSWTPGEDHTGIVFGVWAAEADFLAGEAPDYWYTDGEFTGARIGTTDNNGTTYGVEGFIPGYVHCFGDVTNSTAQIPTGKVQALVINLAGKTLTNAKGFRIGGASGVFKDKLYFIGDYKLHRDSETIEAAAKMAKLTPISLGSFPLTDLGRIIFIDSDI